MCQVIIMAINNKLWNGRLLAKRLFHEHIIAYRSQFAWAILFMIIAALATAALPYLLQPVFDEVFTKNDPKLLLIFCGSVFASFIIKGFASYGEAVVMTYIGQKIITDIQDRLFKHLIISDLSFFHNVPSGELLSRFTNDVNMMRVAMTNTVIGLGKDTLTLFFLIGVMFYRDFTLAAIAFFVFPTVVLPIAKIGRKMRKITHNTQEHIGHFTNQLNQIFQGIRVVKSYCTEFYETNRAFQEINKIFELTYKTARVRSAAHPIVESLGGLAIILVLAYGGWQVMHNDRTTGEFVSFIAALLLAYEPLKKLSNLNANVQEGLASAMRVFALIDTPPQIISPLNPKILKKVKGKVTFNYVSFTYNTKRYAIKDLDFIIEKGSTVALVGASGAGKSTIINLIPRFYDVSAGSILIDDTDIRQLNLQQLRQNIALVSQEISLFNLSVRDNIAYGIMNASIDEIIKAATAAAAHDFILKLPQGYDTVVGENGICVSGGQRQRIAIARAMLKNAPILLLDEATSALDSESEKQVQNALKALMKGRTTIMVAHRLSTVVEADLIYVLDHGAIIEHGNHKSLLAANGSYAKLWQAQAKHG